MKKVKGQALIALSLAMTLSMPNTAAFAKDATPTDAYGIVSEVEDVSTDETDTTTEATVEVVETTSEETTEIAESTNEAEMTTVSGPTQVLVGASDSAVFRAEDEILSNYNNNRRYDIKINAR